MHFHLFVRDMKRREEKGEDEEQEWRGVADRVFVVPDVKKGDIIVTPWVGNFSLPG
jgi:hypothetical protein